MKCAILIAFIALVAGCTATGAREKAAPATPAPATEAGATTTAAPHAAVSAPEPPAAEPADMEHVDLSIEEPLGVSWAPQMVRMPVEFAKPCQADSLELWDDSGALVPFQVVDPVFQKDKLVRCSVAVVTGAKPMQLASFRLYYSSKPPKASRKQPSRLLIPESLMKSILSTGKISARVPTSQGTPKTPIPAGEVPPPIECIMGADNVWRGQGQILSVAAVRKWDSKVLAAGPIFAQVWIRYDFEGEHFYEAVITAVAGSEWLTVSENFDAGNKSCFLLRGLSAESSLIPQRGRPDSRAEIVSRLPAHAVPATITDLPARRYESVAAAMRADKAEATDLFAIFSVAPGTWRNPQGSEINFVRLPSGLAFHFPLEKGTRQWGIYATTLAEGASSSIFRAIARASDVTLDSVLKMGLQPKDSLVLHKEDPLVPPELADAGDAAAAAVKIVLDQGYSAPPTQALDYAAIATAAGTYSQVRAAGHTNSPAGELLHARLLLLGNVLRDPSFYNYDLLLTENGQPGANFDPHTVNWTLNLTRISTLAEIAAAVPSYPNAGEWSRHAASQFDLMLKKIVGPGGVWLDGPDKQAAACTLAEQLADTLKAAGLKSAAGGDFRDLEVLKAMLTHQPPK